MVDAFYADNNRIQVIKNDDISFDTDRPSIELFTGSAITKTSHSIEFPDYITGQAYYRDATAGPTICQLWSTVIWQEWGPDEAFHNEYYFIGAPQNSIPGPTSRNLPRELLGTVPAETTHLDIRVKMTRTVTPAPWLVDQTPVVSFKMGEWINLPGGSCPCERIQNTSRQFDIVRIGNNIYLERRQSVFNADSLLAPGNNVQAAISTNQSGWNSQRILATDLFPKSSWVIAHKIDQRGPDNDGNKRPGGTNPCSGSAPPSRSVYTGDIIITPGRHRT